MKLLLLAILVLLSSFSITTAQREYDQWYFGIGLSLDFRSPIVPLSYTSSISQLEGSASICSKSTGSLLFYTDGQTVWDRTHRVMPGGTGLQGHYSSAQSALIVPMPCDTNTYYLFTADQQGYFSNPTGVNYSIIDMRLRGSLGDTGNVLPIYGPGTYSVEVKTLAGCIGMDSIVVISGFKPSVIISGQTSMCPGDSVVLIATGTFGQNPGSGITKFDWNTGDTTQSIIVHTPGTYSVAVLNGDGCSDTASSDVIYFQSISYSIFGAGPMCPGDSIVLSVLGQYMKVIWNSGDTSRDIMVGSAGTYWAEVIDTNGCVVWTDTVTTSINPIPIFSIISSNGTSLCIGDSTLLTGPPGQFQYLWNGILSNPDTMVHDSGWYVLEVVDSSGCSYTDSVYIQVGSGIKLSIFVSDTVLCVGEVAVMIASPGYFGYVWNNGDTGQILNTMVPGKYWVIGHNASGCGGISDTITVSRATAVNENYADTMWLCRGTTSQIVGSVSNHTSVEWIPSTGLSDSTVENPIVFADTNIVYAVTFTSLDGCKTYDSVYVIVDTIPTQYRFTIGSYHFSALGGVEQNICISADSNILFSGIDSLHIAITYDPGMLRFDVGSLAGGMLGGWTMNMVLDTLGYLEFDLISKGVPMIPGSGEIVCFPVRGYFSNSLHSRLGLSVGVKQNSCYSTYAVGGTVDIDSMCLLNQRLIDGGSVQFKLGQAYPNPSTGQTTIDFSIGLDGQTELRVLTSDGFPVAILFSRYLGSGTYRTIVDFAQLGIPSGNYLYILQSGNWIESKWMTLTK